MSKFAKYKGKINFAVNGEPIELDFKVQDRIELASIYETQLAKDKYGKLLTFCQMLLKRSYPEDTDDEINDFLKTNIDSFIEELMIGAGIVKRGDVQKKKDEYQKKTQE